MTEQDQIRLEESDRENYREGQYDDTTANRKYSSFLTFVLGVDVYEEYADGTKDYKCEPPYVHFPFLA